MRSMHLSDEPALFSGLFGASTNVIRRLCCNGALDSQVPRWLAERTLEDEPMSYEWDPRKAHRAHFLKLGLAWLMAALFSALPVWWIAKEAYL